MTLNLSPTAPASDFHELPALCYLCFAVSEKIFVDRSHRLGHLVSSYIFDACGILSSETRGTGTDLHHLFIFHESYTGVHTIDFEIVIR